MNKEEMKKFEDKLISLACAHYEMDKDVLPKTVDKEAYSYGLLLVI